MTAPTTKAREAKSKTVPLDKLSPFSGQAAGAAEKRTTAFYWIGKMPDTEVERTSSQNGVERKWTETVPYAPCQLILGGHDFPGVQQPIAKKATPGQEQERDRTYGKVVELDEAGFARIERDMARSFVRWRKRKGARSDHGYQVFLPTEAEIAQGKAEAEARKEAYVPPQVFMREGDEAVYKYVFMVRVQKGYTAHGMPTASVEEAGGIQRP